MLCSAVHPGSGGRIRYSRHQKWKDITGCALAGHLAQKKIYCAKLYLGWYDQASLTERKFCRRTMSRTRSRSISNMYGCEVTAEYVPLARIPAVVVVSYNSLINEQYLARRSRMDLTVMDVQ